MNTEDKLARQWLSVLELADQLGNVREAWSLREGDAQKWPICCILRFLSHFARTGNDTMRTLCHSRFGGNSQ